MSTVIEKLTESNIDRFEPEGKIIFKVEKFKEFANEETDKQLYSDEVFIQGIPWKISTYIGIYKTKKLLYCFVQCNRGNKDFIWSCKAKVNLNISSQKQGKEDMQNEFEYNFNSCFTSYGYYHLIELETLMNAENGLYSQADDSIILEANITAEVPQGFIISPVLTEDVLFVNKIKLKVNKHLLAGQSDYFKTFFFNQSFHEAQESSIDDINVDVNAFKRMILTMQPHEVPPDDKCIEHVLPLAQRFLVTSVIVKYEKFLLQESAKSAITKYRLAMEYNMRILKKKVLDGLKKEDFIDTDGNKFAKNYEELAKLSPEQRKQFFERYYELYPEAE